jgi:hypothetical protein
VKEKRGDPGIAALWADDFVILHERLLQGYLKNRAADIEAARHGCHANGISTKEIL